MSAYDNGGINPPAPAWVGGLIDTPNSKLASAAAHQRNRSAHLSDRCDPWYRQPPQGLAHATDKQAEV